MDKTIKDVLDDHLSLCVLSYARLTDRHDGQDLMRNRQDGVMGLAIQAASLFTVASMNALGDSRSTARVLDLASEMFRDLEDAASVGEACLASLELLGSVLLHKRVEPIGGGIEVTSFRQKRRKTPPSP